MIDECRIKEFYQFYFRLLLNFFVGFAKTQIT